MNGFGEKRGRADNGRQVVKSSRASKKSGGEQAKQSRRREFGGRVRCLCLAVLVVVLLLRPSSSQD